MNDKKFQNLIALRFNSDLSGVEAVSIIEAQKGDKSFSVDTSKRTWTDTTGTPVSMEIGRFSRFGMIPLAVIGIYGRNIKHLNKMISDAGIAREKLE